MTAEPTTLASWTRALRKQLDALGLDSAALCHAAGLAPALLDDPNARCPLSVTTRLWQLAVAASAGQPYPVIGLWPVALREDLRRALTAEDVHKVDGWTARYRRVTASFPAEPVDPFFNANTPEQLAEARHICPDLPFLIPGVGAQGGDLEAAVASGVNAAGRLAIINSSRGIIYASSGPEFPEAARREASRLRNAVNQVLESRGKPWP